MIIDHISCKQKQLRAIQQHGESFNKRFACVMKKKNGTFSRTLYMLLKGENWDKIIEEVHWELYPKESSIVFTKMSKL